MPDSTETKNGTIKKVLTGCHVRIVPGWIPPYLSKTTEDEVKYLLAWAKEIMEFIQDHKHQDVNSVSVEEEYEHQCSECGKPWEKMEFDTEDRKAIDDGTFDDGYNYNNTYCAWCGVEIKA